jgi:hypothetical protein
MVLVACCQKGEIARDFLEQKKRNDGGSKKKHKDLYRFMQPEKLIRGQEDLCGKGEAFDADQYNDQRGKTE